MQAIVLSGGVGSRLWPVSNKKCPKPFIKLDDGQSLLQKVFIRAINVNLVTNIITVANENLYLQIKEEYNKVNELVARPIQSNFILEPFGRNTAAAIASAALHVKEYYGSDEIMLILPADHLILDQRKFEIAITKARKLAQKGSIVTFGIKPDSPETGYGYIKYKGNKVEEFIEKPNLKLAMECLATDNFLWNSGIFCFSAGSILREMKKYCPNILKNVRYSMPKFNGIDDKAIRINPSAFKLAPEQSIDYAVIEKSKKVVVVPCDIGWSDVGNWESLSNLSPVDSNGNIIKGSAKLHDVSNCYIENNGQLVGAVGVKDLAIISTKNGLLVTNKKSSEAVKRIYSKIQKDVNKVKKFHWGALQEIESNQQVMLHRLTINSNTSFDLSKYFKYTANWMVVSGIAQFKLNDQFVNISANESRYISKEHLGNISNLQNDSLIIITIQLDDYFYKNAMISQTINKI